jgi:hypothetical protein
MKSPANVAGLSIRLETPRRSQRRIGWRSKALRRHATPFLNRACGMAKPAYCCRFFSSFFTFLASFFSFIVLAGSFFVDFLAS